MKDAERMGSRAALIREILLRMKTEGYRSFDHYDFWGSPAGIFLRRHKNPLTLPLIGAAYSADVLFPMLFRSERERRLPMETLPGVMRAMAVYARATGDAWFEKDRHLLPEMMLERAGRSAHGVGVGHPFGWWTTVFIPPGTPCAPLTAHLADYLLADSAADHAEALGEMGEFLHRDLHMEELDAARARVSYTPLDARRVVNANAFAARTLYKLGGHFGRARYKEAGEKILNYVLSLQEPDGGWFYFEKGTVPDKENFIDCFHSAFVLETLLEWAAEGHAGAASALDRGLERFISAFVAPSGAVRPFAKSHLPIPIGADIRSSAEALALMARASRRRPECLGHARAVLGDIMRNMYDGKGGFYFRRFGWYTCKVNYARWGAAPMAAALADLMLAEGDG